MMMGKIMSPIRPEMKKRYPRDWKLRSRFVREIRAKNRCEWCGVKNGAWLSARCCARPIFDGKNCCLTCGKKWPRVVLTAAHIFDHRPEAASLLNLAALCQRCHNRHDAKMRAIGRRARADAESRQMRMFLGGF